MIHNQAQYLPLFSIKHILNKDTHELIVLIKQYRNIAEQQIGNCVHFVHHA